MLNPWIRTESGLARAYIRSHYLKRLGSRKFWNNLAKGKIEIRNSVADFLIVLKKALLDRSSIGGSGPVDSDALRGKLSLRQKMINSFSHFEGKLLVILSENDLTAEEFKGLFCRHHNWKKRFKRSDYSLAIVPETDHTFSRLVWRRSMERVTLNWIRSINNQER